MYVTPADTYNITSTHFGTAVGTVRRSRNGSEPGAGGVGRGGSLIAGARYCFASPGGPSGSVGTDGRIPPDPRDGRARRRVRDAFVHRLTAARTAAAERRETESVRVRNRARAGAGRTLPGEVLPRRDELHRARRRDGLTLPRRAR